MRKGPWVWIALILMLLIAVWRWFSHAPKWREGDRPQAAPTRQLSPP